MGVEDCMSTHAGRSFRARIGSCSLLAASVASLAASAPARQASDHASESRVTPPRETLFIKAERVIVRPDEELVDAAVLVRDGRIVAVGQGLVAPEGARQISGKVVCAAFLDAWVGIEESTEPNFDPSASAATRAVDAIDAYVAEHDREQALRAGVTCARVQTSVNAKLAGVGAVIRLAPSLPAGERVLLAESDISMSVGLSSSSSALSVEDDQAVMRFGEPRRMDPFDRVAELDRVLGAVENGKNYLQSKVEYQHEHEAWKKKIAEKEAELEKDAKKAKKDREKEMKDAEEKKKEFKEKKYTEDKEPQPPRYNEDNEVLARVADGDLPLIVQAHRSSEIRGLLDGLRKHDRVRLILAGATEASAVAHELADREVTVLLRPSLRGRGVADELEGSDLALAARLDADGVTVLVGSAGIGANASRDLPLLAAICAGNGLSNAKAFDAVTLAAARALDVSDRIGSVERGKDAELLVLDGDPLALTSNVQYVISSGRVVVTPEN